MVLISVRFGVLLVLLSDPSFVESLGFSSGDFRPIPGTHFGAKLPPN